MEDFIKQKFPDPEDRDSTFPSVDPRDVGKTVGVSHMTPKTIGSNHLTAIEEAHKVIYGDREETYGDPGKNLRTIAAYWSTHLKAKYGQTAPLTVDDVCVMMVLLKQARLVNSPKHRDSIVDSIGYMALADRVNVAEQEADKQANSL